MTRRTVRDDEQPRRSLNLIRPPSPLPSFIFKKTLANWVDLVAKPACFRQRARLLRLFAIFARDPARFHRTNNYLNICLILANIFRHVTLAIFSL